MDMNRVIELMTLVILKKPLGAEWADHQLSGSEWKGAREAHVGGDFLLVYDADDDFVLPAGGFVVRYPFLFAFCAREIDGVEYDRPAFFVVRSLEGKMYLRAERVHIYHGFGPPNLRLGGKEFVVETEIETRIW